MKKMNMKKPKKNVMSELKKELRPEFLNRIDDIIVFHKLNNEDIKQIIDIMLNELKQRIENQGYKIEFDESIKELIANRGINKAYGARPLKRTIQNLVEDKIAEYILVGKIKKGEKKVLEIKNDEVILK